MWKNARVYIVHVLWECPVHTVTNTFIEALYSLLGGSFELQEFSALNNVKKTGL